jgi:hypothetical protein
MRDIKSITVSDFKKAPSKVLDEANRTGESVAVVRNNVIEGYYAPVGKMQITRPSERAIAEAIARVFDIHGDTLARLAKK